MTLAADSLGVVRGKFTIPPNVPAGNKKVTFVGAGGQYGEAAFSGQGILDRQTMQSQTDITTQLFQVNVDPLAQTFTMKANTQIVSVDLWFVVKPTTPTSIQIRETTAGFPDRRILAESVVAPASIAIGGVVTNVPLSQPVLLLADVEYAIVVLCGDPVGSLAVAEIGKFDVTAQKWITEQAYSIGVLLSSSNASTWTAHQDRDMTFRLLAASYTQTSRTVQLGNVPVVAATDLLLLAFAERPDGSTDVQYTLTLPDASVVTVSDGQPVQLTAPITGNIAVAAVIRGSQHFAPVIYPGSQLIAGVISQTAEYVSRAIPGGAAVKVKVIYEAFIPSGATVTVKYKGPDAGDTWIAVPQTVLAAADDGFVELTHELTGINELSVQIKLTLTGTAAARPRVRDLRAFVM